MNKNIIFVAMSFIATLSLSSEISVFDAGNLNTQNPYGLTDNEKQLLRNKRDVATLESSLSSMQEQVQGIQSVLEGLSSKILKIEQRISDVEMRLNSDSNGSIQSVSSLKAYVDEAIDLQKKNYANIQVALKKLGNLIDKKSSEASIKTDYNEKNTPKKDLSKMDNKKILDDAIKLFNSNKFTEAKYYFEYLVGKKTRLGISNFYLAEIAYKDKNYGLAIKHYQKSIEADDKASYITKLLYHTAVSFDKVGDTSSANRFYKALKVGYPDSKEAKISPDRK